MCGREKRPEAPLTCKAEEHKLSGQALPEVRSSEIQDFPVSALQFISLNRLSCIKGIHITCSASRNKRGGTRKRSSVELEDLSRDSAARSAERTGGAEGRGGREASPDPTARGEGRPLGESAVSQRGQAGPRQRVV